MTEPNEFAAVDVPERVVVMGAREITLRPLTIGQLPAFSRALKAAVPALEAMLSGDGDIGASDVVGLLADHGDAVLEALAVATKLDRSEIDNLDPATAMSLVGEVMAINRDFFARRLAPALTKAREAASK